MTAFAYSIEVDGVTEAHADSKSEAVMIAGYLNVSVWCADTPIDWRRLHPIRRRSR